MGTLTAPALGLRNSQGAPRQTWGCASHPTGMAVPGDSHLQVCRELLLLHQPGGRRDVAGAGEGCFAQLGRLLLRFLSHCKSRGCPSVPPRAKRGAQLWLHALHHPRGAGGEMLGRFRLFPLPRHGGEGRGGRHDTALQLGKECEQPPQILGCWPCYIRGFSRVTSAPQLASDLVSVATLSGPEGYHSRKTEGPVPEVTPCTTPWVLLPVGRKRQKRQIRLEELTAGLQHVPCPGPWQGSEPGQHPLHMPCQGTWGAEICLAPLKAPVVPAGARAWAAQGHPHVPGRAETRTQHNVRAQPGRANASRAAEKNLENPNLDLVPT